MQEVQGKRTILRVEAPEGEGQPERRGKQEVPDETHCPLLFRAEKTEVLLPRRNLDWDGCNLGRGFIFPTSVAGFLLSGEVERQHLVHSWHSVMKGKQQTLRRQ